MIRKHVKVELDRWYYWCDTMGILVWHDMPAGDNRSDAAKTQFALELKRMIDARRNHPSIGKSERGHPLSGTRETRVAPFASRCVVLSQLFFHQIAGNYPILTARYPRSYAPLFSVILGI